MRVLSFFAFLGCWEQALNQELCAQGDCVEGLQDDASLLQVRHEAVPAPKKSMHTHGPYRVERGPFDYFRHWSAGALRSALSQLDPEKDGIPQVGFLQAEVNESVLTWTQQCPNQADKKTQVLELIIDADTDRVHHALYRDGNANLQYVAMTQGGTQGKAKILHADPPVCRSSELAKEGERHAEEADEDYEEDGKPEVAGKAGAPEQLLDPYSDPAVKDCVALFSRTVKENCGKHYDFTVLTASVEIIDGLKVRLDGVVSGGSQLTHHSPRCLFEEGKKSADTKDVPKGKLLPEELHGQRATLEMETAICQVGDKNGTNADIQTNLFMLDHGMGSLGRMKGYEHVNDDLPILEELDVDVESAGDSLDFRRKYPRCFPTGSKSPVRSQGQCGSCWAFASASATMNSLCIKTLYGTRPGKSSDVLSATGLRYEISVQQIISCGPGTGGCKGGWEDEANKKFKKNGLDRERDNKYMCSGGDSLKHFEEGNSCKQFPWNGRCKSGRNRGWKYDGAYSLTTTSECERFAEGGECTKNPGYMLAECASACEKIAEFGTTMNIPQANQRMMQALIQGYSLWVDFDHHESFSGSIGKGVYGPIKTKLGRKRGCHAVAVVGYGVAPTSVPCKDCFSSWSARKPVKYWIIQNSWGRDWCDNGYMKFRRGNDVCGIESRTTAFKASPTATGAEATCPQNFPVCDSEGDCVTQSCAAGGCSWHRGSNYLSGIDNEGTKCKSSYPQATCPQNFPVCDSEGDCVTQSCAAGGCYWKQGSNYLSGIDNEGTKCKSSYSQAREFLAIKKQNGKEKEAEIADNEEKTKDSEPGHFDEDEQGVDKSELETNGDDIQDASEAAEGDDAKIPAAKEP